MKSVYQLNVYYNETRKADLGIWHGRPSWEQVKDALGLLHSHIDPKLLTESGVVFHGHTVYELEEITIAAGEG